MTPKKILLLYTGGTIGSMYDEVSGALKPVDFSHLKQWLPELNRLDVDVEVVSVKQPVDSSEIMPENWVEMVELLEENYDSFDGFVILHGTDTMAYSASALSFMLENLTKPVIFTGSQLPVNVLRSDGKENILTAVEMAACEHNMGPRIREVCVYFQSKLYRGNRTIKISAENFHAFDSPNLSPLALAGVHIEWSHDLISGNSGQTIFHKKTANRVATITLFPGVNMRAVEAICRLEEIDAIVLRSYGSGNAPIKTGLPSILKEAIDAGKIIVNISQCISGRVEQEKYHTGKALLEAGVIGGDDMTFEAAITKLMVLLGQELKGEALIQAFVKNLRGEKRID